MLRAIYDQRNSGSTICRQHVDDELTEWKSLRLRLSFAVPGIVWIICMLCLNNQTTYYIGSALNMSCFDIQKENLVQRPF